MMTIEELDAVPIGGKVEARGDVSTFTKISDVLWECENGESIPGDWMINWGHLLTPVTEPQTWQDAARAQGWAIAEDGSCAVRFTPHCRVFVITLDHGMFSLHLPGDEIPDGFSFIGDALEKADKYASLIGGWA